MTSFEYFPQFSNPCHDILCGDSAKGIHFAIQPEINVAMKLDKLLQRVAELTTADKLKPTRFNARGQAHANRIAQQDRNHR